MKKRLFHSLLFLLPVFAAAQNGQVLVKDFEKKVDFLTATCRVNDHLNIAEIAIDKDHFELIAVDEKMQAVWRSQPMNGFPRGVGRFKGQLLAVSFSEAKSKSEHDTYSAYLFDTQSGKLLLQKVLYTVTSPMFVLCQPSFAEDGSWFKFMARETKQKQTSHGLFISSAHMMETEHFTLVDVNEKLDIITTNPAMPDGFFAGFEAGSTDSFFLLALQPNGMLKAAKFKSGIPEPAAVISQQLDIKGDPDWDMASLNSCASQSEKDVVFFDITNKNLQKDNQLTVCKFDFGANTCKKVAEVLTRRHLKDIEKAFALPNKKLDDPDIEGADIQEVKYMADNGGTLIVTFGAKVPWQQNYILEGSTIINGYDKDMNLKFQQIMPNMTVYGPTSNPQPSFYHQDNKMYMIANRGNMTFYTIYGQLDLNTGKWLKLERLAKDKLDKSDCVTPNNLWYKDNFVLFYIPFKNGLNSKLNFSLQSNPY